VIGSNKEALFSAKILGFTENGWPINLYTIITSDHLYEFKHKGNHIPLLTHVGDLKRAIQIQDIESIYLSVKEHVTSTRHDMVIHYAGIFKQPKKS
jgi:hypothetical protein